MASPGGLLALLLTLLLLPRAALAGPSGVIVLGGSGYPEEPPVASFGEPGSASEVVLTAVGDAVEVRRGGSVQMSFGEEVAQMPSTVLQGGDMRAESILASGVPQWSLWDLDTFDSASTGTWTLDSRSSCGSDTDLFLGGHCKLGAANTARRYVQLPPHSRIRIRARVHYFDEWHGEAVALQADDATVWAQAHAWCPGFLTWKCIKYGIDSCGGDTPDRISVKVEATLPHTASTLDLAFASNLVAGTDPCRVSWGVDDVSIELMLVPEPPSNEAAGAGCAPSPPAAMATAII